MTVITQHRFTSLFKGQSVLVFGALGATLLGALVALEFDRLVAVGDSLMLPVGQEALIGAVTTAGLAGFLAWVACALVVRTINRVALTPYLALTDQLEAVADGTAGSGIELSGAVPGVRRLARVILTFHNLLIASQRSEAALQMRYDALAQANAAERHSLMAILIDRAAASGGRTVPVMRDVTPPSAFDIPEQAAAPLVDHSSVDEFNDPIDLTDQLDPLRRSPAGPTSH